MAAIDLQCQIPCKGDGAVSERFFVIACLVLKPEAQTAEIFFVATTTLNLAAQSHLDTLKHEISALDAWHLNMLCVERHMKRDLCFPEVEVKSRQEKQQSLCKW